MAIKNRKNARPVNTNLDAKTQEATLDVRTNMFANKKYNPSLEMKKGNATPLTTNSGRISYGEHGAFWAGQLNAFAVWVDETQEWGYAMYDENSVESGLVGILLAYLVDMEFIEESQVEEYKNILFWTDLKIDIPWSQENLIDFYEEIEENGVHHLDGTIEFTIGVKSNGELILSGSFVGDQKIEPGKVQVTLANNKVVIGRAYSRYAKAPETDGADLKSAFQAGFKKQSTKNQERKARYANRNKTVSTTANIVPEKVEDNNSNLPPQF